MYFFGLESIMKILRFIVVAVACLLVGFFLRPYIVNAWNSGKSSDGKSANTGGKANTTVQTDAKLAELEKKMNDKFAEQEKNYTKQLAPITSATQQFTRVFSTENAKEADSKNAEKQKKLDADMTDAAAKLLSAPGIAKAAKSGVSQILHYTSGYPAEAEAEADAQVKVNASLAARTPQPVSPTPAATPKPLSALSPKQAQEAVELQKDISALEAKIAKDTGDLAEAREGARGTNEPHQLWLWGVDIKMNLNAIEASEKRLTPKKEELARLLR